MGIYKLFQYKENYFYDFETKCALKEFHNLLNSNNSINSSISTSKDNGLSYIFQRSGKIKDEQKLKENVKLYFFIHSSKYIGNISMSHFQVKNYEEALYNFFLKMTRGGEDKETAKSLELFFVNNLKVCYYMHEPQKCSVYRPLFRLIDEHRLHSQNPTIIDKDELLNNLIQIFEKHDVENRHIARMNAFESLKQGNEIKKHLNEARDKDI